MPQSLVVLYCSLTNFDLKEYQIKRIKKRIQIFEINRKLLLLNLPNDINNIINNVIFENELKNKLKYLLYNRGNLNKYCVYELM